MRKAYLYFLLLLLVPFLAHSQTAAKFDARLVVDSVDCINNFLFLRLEVKATDPPDPSTSFEFLMGDQNYKFKYNRHALQNPTIDQELGFTLSNLQPYFPHNTNGSIDPGMGDSALTVINVAWIPGGSPTFGLGTLVKDSVWMPVNRIRFNIADPVYLECLSLTWLPKSTNVINFTNVTKVDGLFNTSPTQEGLFAADPSCLPGICATLPVVWSSFEGTLRGEDAQLEWSMLREVNNDYFAIERSVDGSNFKEVGRIPGAGASTQPTQYEFADQEVAKLGSPVLYYRLRQVDLDGAFSYSDNIVEISLGQGLDISLEVYPNPATDEVNISYYTGSQEGIALEILDVKGQVVLTRSLSQNAGVVTIDTRSLARGVYLVKAYHEFYVETTKLVIR